MSAWQNSLSPRLTFLDTPFVPDKRSSQVNLTQLLNYPKMSLAHPSLCVCVKTGESRLSLKSSTVGGVGRRLDPQNMKA